MEECLSPIHGSIPSAEQKASYCMTCMITNQHADWWDPQGGHFGGLGLLECFSTRIMSALKKQQD